MHQISKKLTYNFKGDKKKKSFIINYAKNLTKNDIDSFVKNNNIEISEKDKTIIYNHIKTYYKVFFNDPIKYIKMLKGKIEDDIYYQILMIYDKYKNYL